MDYYKILEVNKNASKEEIKKSYKRLALKYHPDLHSHSSKSVQDDATRRFKLLSEAYQFLSDDRKRADYNIRSSSSSSTYNNNARGYGNSNYYKSSYTPKAHSDGAFSKFHTAFRFFSTRAFLLNLVFAGALLGGAVVIDRSNEALWKMHNSGKSFEDAMESIEKSKAGKHERNSNAEQDELPEYMKLFLKQKKRSGTWVDSEAEAAYKKMEELHAAQIEQYGNDNLTTVEVYTQVFGNRSGHVRGMETGPPPLKRINDFGQHTSNNCVTEANIDARKESEMKERYTEFSKKREEMNQRFEEFSKKRENEIRKQVQAELEDKFANKLIAEMELLMSRKLALFQESQTSTSKNQSSSPLQETPHAIFDKRGKDKFYYKCLCGLEFKDAKTYMVHRCKPEHYKRMQNLKKTLEKPSTISNQATKRRINRRIKKEK
ncbi:Chaperone protein dnaJ 72 [Euphorbia peplus]|nr:Chaperone protein dnaJ 72 [Euphorbia peplus]